jgi:hypothetical protein
VADVDEAALGRARRARREEVVAELERSAVQLERGARLIDPAAAERDALEVRAAVAGRLEAEPLEVRGEVLGRLVQPARGRVAPLHRVGGDDVEVLAQSVGGDEFRGVERRRGELRGGARRGRGG